MTLLGVQTIQSGVITGGGDMVILAIYIHGHIWALVLKSSVHVFRPSVIPGKKFRGISTLGVRASEGIGLPWLMNSHNLIARSCTISPNWRSFETGVALATIQTPPIWVVNLKPAL